MRANSPNEKARARRRRRRRLRGWRYRIPAFAFRRKYPPIWKLKNITRKHREEGS